MKNSIYAVAIMIALLLLAGCKKEKINVSGQQNGHEYADLGLNVMWATCNMGATTPEGFGDYYAWGETTTKSDYSWETYTYADGTWKNENRNGETCPYLTKYCNEKPYGAEGFTDGMSTLEPADDVARTKWGETWHIPTSEEWKELLDKCTWTWGTHNGINGYIVEGPNGNSIFLPAAGYRAGTGLNYIKECGYFWSSTLDSSRPDHACHVGFLSGGRGSGHYGRYFGYTIRPVCIK